ncbi:ABC transporter substrate-binding protein [Paenarthrobacter nitroguajacolicus]|uniref:ABC transporter substrate-binding protein n=1 Tax=Paenarthrobacter nitroguajacolicus TaxID=211146 RepID=A0A558GYG4_PAENT|nr:ABC transporter substrate-binding protein [Paenarthrobacter nitroguajacolicus]TVU61940.1 ABC transporter substrate-binding protein [Paenarthrobacter nitroguajacolicus]
MPRTRHLLTAGALTMGAALTLTGCFAGEGTSAQASSNRVSLAMLAAPMANLSPYSEDAFKLSRWSAAETLTVLDDNGEAQPLLATEWKKDGDLKWVLTLREGVKFHDGTPLTAESVVTSLNKALNASPKLRVLTGLEVKFEATGDREVTITTGTPDPLMMNRLTSPQLSILSAAAYLPDGTVTPVGTGTGPFKIVTTNGSSSAALDRFEDYWGEKAKLSGIDVSYVPDGAARAAALRTGTADIVEALPVSQVSLLPQDLVNEVPMPRTSTLYLNNEKGAFADPALRAAARAAIDRASIVQNVYEGRADESKGLLGPALKWAAEIRGDVDSIARPAAPAGQKITLATYTARPELPEAAVLLEQQLEAAGFVVEQDVREYANMEKDMMAGVFDMVLLSRATVQDTGDPATYLTSDYSCKGSFNISQVCDPEIDAVISAASASELGEKRREAIMAAEALILKKDAALPVLHERVLLGKAKTVSNLVLDPRERGLITAETTKE